MLDLDVIFYSRVVKGSSFLIGLSVYIIATLFASFSFVNHRVVVDTEIILRLDVTQEIREVNSLIYLVFFVLSSICPYGRHIGLVVDGIVSLSLNPIIATEGVDIWLLRILDELFRRRVSRKLHWFQFYGILIFAGFRGVSCQQPGKYHCRRKYQCQCQ
ncbi:Uncharacterised protein [Chlamydia trachomatis]|nr:Uncharacterised protein [Chlamydia trachomatis]